MRRMIVFCGITLAIAFALYFGLASSEARWAGIDETVVNKIAVEANRPPSKPLIDIGQGDLPLFMFLVAGAIGGFGFGYSFRELFPPKGKADGDATGV